MTIVRPDVSGKDRAKLTVMASDPTGNRLSPAWEPIVVPESLPSFTFPLAAFHTRQHISVDKYVHAEREQAPTIDIGG